MADIRRAAARDLDALLPMVRDFHRHEQVELDDSLRRDVLARIVADAALGTLLVADGPLGLQGYVAVLWGTSIEFGGRYAFVDELYVDPALRGQGLGTRLLATAERAATLAGARVAFLEVADANGRALELYRRRGYRLHDRRLMSKPVAAGPGAAGGPAPQAPPAEPSPPS